LGMIEIGVKLIMICLLGLPDCPTDQRDDCGGEAVSEQSGFRYSHGRASGVSAGGERQSLLRRVDAAAKRNIVLRLRS
jgi:hypothetical protein